MVQLVPMTNDEFQTYLQTSIAKYAEEHIQAGNWDATDAMQNAEMEFRSLLPDGVATKNQHLLIIKDPQSSENIGLIWFAEKYQGAPTAAFIYDILIYEVFRQKGYGRQTLAAVEEKAKELGMDTILLHVFGKNPNAFRLYQKSGYEITNVRMAKKLSE